MDVAARPSKGQITIPKPVRDALGLHEGDQVVFRLVEGERAILARYPTCSKSPAPSRPGGGSRALGRSAPSRVGGPGAGLSAFVD